MPLSLNYQLKMEHLLGQKKKQTWEKTFHLIVAISARFYILELSVLTFLDNNKRHLLTRFLEPTLECNACSVLANAFYFICIHD